MNIKTEQHYSDMWTAIDDNTYDGPGSAIGRGENEQDAINDLLEEVMLRHLDQLDREESFAQTQDRERNR